MAQIKVTEIQPEQAYTLRHKVLWPHKTIQECQYPGDKAPGAFHFGSWKEGRIVGIVSAYPEKCDLFDEIRQYRIRGMATEPALRGQGYGAVVIINIMQKLKAQNIDLVWFNAREVAFSFYEKLGFIFASDMFEIEGIGPHKVMYANVKEWKNG